jgi:hypothetical protein
MSILRKLFSSGPAFAPIPVDNEAGCAQMRDWLAAGEDEAVFDWLNTLKARSAGTRNVDFLRALYFQRKKQLNAATQALREELRYFPEHAEARALLDELTRRLRPVEVPGDEEFKKLYAEIRENTMVGPARLWSIFQRAKEVCADDLPGNFVECGVAAGGSSALLATVIRRYSRRERRLFACDSFQGMPPASEHDTHRGRQAEETGWGTGTCAAPMESLDQLCRKMGVRDLVEPVQGLFEQTLPVNRGRFGPIALLHMDGDWYSSTRDILENLFDQVVPGGRIQIDDYGFWEGCERAVTEFEAKRQLHFTLHDIDETGVWMVK